MDVFTKMSNEFWERDDVQFPRLIAEIKAVRLTPDQVREITASMDITREELSELLDRAEKTFESIKKNFDTVETTCVHCGGKVRGE